MPVTDRTRWSIRWWELVPEALLVGALTFFFFDEMDAATSAFKSGRALVLMLGIGGVWIVARLLLARFVRWPVARLVPFAVGAVVVFSVVVLPAYRDKNVVETLDTRALVAPTPTTDAMVPSAMTPSATTPTPQSTTAPEPVAVRTSMFRGVDHRASGTVNLYRRVDGRYVVGLEDFAIQPGPDYDVYVVPGADRTDRDDGTRIDDLRGNTGTQFYDTPSGVDLERGAWTVLVWCQTFGVPVANATFA